MSRGSLSVAEVEAVGALSRDQRACYELLREGSKSFHAASLLLPKRLRAPVAVVYAFCRVADDAIDESEDPTRALADLHERLDAIYAMTPRADPVDRALSRVVDEERLPRAPFDALLEGFAWDVEGRTYESLEELRGYCVRVASSVGLMMTALMGERREAVLARAADLGIAMQLTNIARDVGEDARNGRIYVPREWLRELGLVEADLLSPSPGTAVRPEIGLLVRRLLLCAERHYLLAEPAVAHLPRDCRWAIASAGRIYRDIGRVIVDNGYDSITQRAHTTKPRKAWLLARALPAALLPEGRPSDLPADPSAIALVQATANMGYRR